ncbi:MAG TPA: LysM peptidoglycan-binding domain-containing protein [Candidatus Paceibacterota bacterium]
MKVTLTTYASVCVAAFLGLFLVLVSNNITVSDPFVTDAKAHTAVSATQQDRPKAKAESAIASAPKPTVKTVAEDQRAVAVHVALKQTDAVNIKAYIVARGDTLWRIAESHKTTVSAIMAMDMNPKLFKRGDPNRIYANEVIYIPLLQKEEPVTEVRAAPEGTPAVFETSAADQPKPVRVSQQVTAEQSVENNTAASEAAPQPAQPFGIGGNKDGGSAYDQNVLMIGAIGLLAVSVLAILLFFGIWVPWKQSAASAQSQAETAAAPHMEEKKEVAQAQGDATGTVAHQGGAPHMQGVEPIFEKEGEAQFADVSDIAEASEREVKIDTVKSIICDMPMEDVVELLNKAVMCDERGNPVLLRNLYRFVESPQRKMFQRFSVKSLREMYADISAHTMQERVAVAG